MVRIRSKPPPGIERVTMMVSWPFPSSAKRRHATFTIPVTGSIAIVAPWLTGSSERLKTIGVVHVTPQSIDRENMIVPVNSVPVPRMTV